MSDKHYPDQPSNSSYRRLLTMFFDRKDTDKARAEIHKVDHEANDPPPDFLQLERKDESEIEATVAQLAGRIDALAEKEAADVAQTRQVLEAVTQQLRQLDEYIKFLQQSPDSQEQAKARRLGRARAELWAAVSGGLPYLAAPTGDALYQDWVQKNLWPLLPEWVQRPWEAFVHEQQPASPAARSNAPQPGSEPPPPTLEPQGQQVNHVSVPQLETVHIPAGWFLMGSDKRKDPMARDDELPQHWVWLDDFWIGKHPVTNQEYDVFVRAAGYRTPGTWRNGSVPVGKERFPVCDVSWYDAHAYCEWLSKHTGRNYRLPTEAEWEKAARGADGRIYPWGNQPPDNQLCNYGHNVAGHTTPVSAFPAGASPYGALDVAGNVWEWTSTLWKDGLFAPAPSYRYPYDSQDGRERIDMPGYPIRVVRGGSFYNLAADVRCACRSSGSPDLGLDYLGFRVVASSFASGL